MKHFTKLKGFLSLLLILITGNLFAQTITFSSPASGSTTNMGLGALSINAERTTGGWSGGNGNYTFNFTQVSGPVGGVSFSPDPISGNGIDNATTTATFTALGTYVIGCTVNENGGGETHSTSAGNNITVVVGTPSLTLNPATTQNLVYIAGATSQSITATVANFSGTGNYNYAWSVTPSATISGTNPQSSASATNTKTITFGGLGTYTVSLTASRGTTVLNQSVTVNVLAPNAWSSSGTESIRAFVLDPNAGNILAGPVALATPSTSTAALAKNAGGGPFDADGCIYYLNRDDNSALNGVVTVYSVKPDGTSNGSRGTIDMNGALNDDFSFVRLGFDATGRGWILAGSGNNIYIASFQGNGTAAISNINTFGANSLTVPAPGSASEFQNGDLAITANGTLYAVANVTDGQTYVYTLNSLASPTTLTRKWTVQTGGNTFSGSVNGIAWTQSGSMYISTSTGMYFLDQATANSNLATVQTVLVPNSAGYNFTDLGSDKFPTQTTLPVTLISFAGTYRNQTTNLNWVTENLQSFDRFEVERSSNGTSFATIAIKQTPSDVSARTTYLYNDDLSAVSGSVFYYRLKMIDIDGKFKYSSVILVRKDQKSIVGLTLSPNPVISGNSATVRFDAAAKTVVDFKVVDMSGRILLKQQNSVTEGTNSIAISNLDRLQPGMYILQMVDGANVNVTKFTIAH